MLCSPTVKYPVAFVSAAYVYDSVSQHLTVATEQSNNLSVISKLRPLLTLSALISIRL